MNATTQASEQAQAPSRAVTRRRLTRLAAAHAVTIHVVTKHVTVCGLIAGPSASVAGLAQLRTMVLAARSRQAPA